jgi:hypothetical protein
MNKPNRNESWTEAERRVASSPGRPIVGGVPVRDHDIESARGLHSVAILFRVLAGLLGVIIVLQVINAVTSIVDISYGVLIVEVIRLVIFAGLLWGAGELADLFVKSHSDLRASRILLGRLISQVGYLSDIERRG